MSIPPGGGSLLIAWQLKDKQVLIVGGGEVASGRIASVLAADALVTVLCPHSGLHSATQRLLTDAAAAAISSPSSEPRVVHHDRTFAGPDDLVDVDMVLTAIDDVTASREICALCRTRRIPVNAADLPSSCDFFFGSQIRDGPLQIMISTNGHGPKLANILRRHVEACLPRCAGRAVERVGELRARLKERAPGVGGPVSKRRMGWMTQVCTAWKMQDLALLDEKMIEQLLDSGWERDRVPTIDELRGTRRLLRTHFSFSSLSFLTTFAFVAGAGCVLALAAIRPRP